jgi:hypothetical protein
VIVTVVTGMVSVAGVASSVVAKSKFPKTCILYVYVSLNILLL